MNIIHRDIKPENILLLDKSSDFKIKIIDYGTSRKYETVRQISNKAYIVFYCLIAILFSSRNI